MINVIDRDEVRGLIGRGAQLVDVLPARQYEEAHLPNAISIPLETLDTRTVAQLHWNEPVVVYCSDCL